MTAMNRVFLAGNLTRDPEVRALPSGQTVADFGLAINENYKNKDGQTVETTCFADVAAWGPQAEACKEHLGKGAPVLVEGRLQFERWETDKGETRTRLRVRANRVIFLGRSRRGNGPPDAAPAPAKAAPSAAAGPAAPTGGHEETMPF